MWSGVGYLGMPAISIDPREPHFFFQMWSVGKSVNAKKDERPCEGYSGGLGEKRSGSGTRQFSLRVFRVLCAEFSLFLMCLGMHLLAANGTRYKQLTLINLWRSAAILRVLNVSNVTHRQSLESVLTEKKRACGERRRAVSGDAKVPAPRRNPLPLCLP